MKQIDFERALKRHCIKHRAGCTDCDLRLYCHLPPCERTDAIMIEVIAYLEQDADEYAALQHHPGCPLEIRFEGAVGYKEWNEMPHRMPETPGKHLQITENKEEGEK